jgi:hypothetical protein
VTNAGTASGATRSTFQTRRPGRVVRSTSQAAAVPTAAHSSIPPRVSRAVFTISSPTRGRTTRRYASAQPMLTV